MRLAFAASRPSCPRSVPASRATQRSQRTPLTWIVSLWMATRPMLAGARHEIGGDGHEPVAPPDLELAVGFRRLAQALHELP